MPITLYATQANVEQILSEFGVDMRARDLEEDTATMETNRVTAALQKATADVNHCLLQHYTVAVASASTWVTWCTAYLAAAELCRRRGNPVPQAIAEEAARYWAELQLIKSGQQALVGDDGLAVPTYDVTPSVSNMTIDPRYRFQKVRRVARTSTGGSQAPGRKQNDVIDWGYEQ